MANQAFGSPDDILFGGGELYVAVNNDEDEWKHLGNVDEFTITTEINTIEKNASMNEKRELFGRVTTALSITAEATLTEYDYRNVAAALYGDANVIQQAREFVIRKDYVVKTVPGIISVTNKSEGRAFSITDVAVMPPSTLASRGFWSNDRGYGDISQSSTGDDTFTAKAGGVIRISTANANITDKYFIYVCVTKTPKMIGDLDGLDVQIYDGNTNTTLYNSFGTGTTATVTLSNGIEITFEVSPTASFGVMSQNTEEGIEARIMPSISSYTKNIDYIVDEQGCRAGIIRIPSDSNILVGDTIQVTCTIPDKNLYVISGGSRKEIVGKLLFVPDANTGPNYVIEGWKVHIYPEGDLAGLISNNDFGSYKIRFSFVADYANHPEAPHLAMTLVDYGQQDIKPGIYDAEY